MKVVITSATEKEILQVKQTLNPAFTKDNEAFSIKFHQSGVGILASCFTIAQLIFQQKPDLVIQAGIAGTFYKESALGQVVAVKHEITADTGVEENEVFKDLFELRLQNGNEFPFTNQKLINTFLPGLNFLKLPEVTGITVNEISTRKERITQLQLKYKPWIETMEGASLHYCCLQTSTPFIQIRATSNYIGERDKLKWKFADAFENLTHSIIQYVTHLYNLQPRL